MEEKCRLQRKVSSFLAQLERTANSNNRLRQSEIRRSFCICRVYPAAFGPFLSIGKAEGQFILPSDIIQSVGLGGPVPTMIEVR